MPMKVTTLRLTQRLWTLLESQARKEGTSASQLVREGAMMRLGYALGKQDRQAVLTNESRNLQQAGPYRDFESAAAELLDHLHEHLGFSLWLVSAVEGDDWVIKQVRDEGYGAEPGLAFPFADTHCARMVEGLAPHIAPEVSSVPAYATAPLGKAVPIAAYVGVPLLRPDGSLYGTLCAVDPSPQPPGIVAELPLLTLGGRLLSTLLEHDAEHRRN